MFKDTSLFIIFSLCKFKMSDNKFSPKPSYNVPPPKPPETRLKTIKCRISVAHFRLLTNNFVQVGGGGGEGGGGYVIDVLLGKVEKNPKHFGHHCSLPTGLPGHAPYPTLHYATHGLTLAAKGLYHIVKLT